MTRYAFFACLAVAGCAGTAGAPPQRTYLCEGGRMAAVSFAGESARVRLANEDLELRRTPSASGARYSNERATLHTRDDEALLTLDGRELGPCQEVKNKQAS
jgi:membrane-bound inhibitor of C-type lysozyme